MKHVIEAQQFDRADLDQLFTEADACMRGDFRSLRGKILLSLFYEPSTRTRLSFESAMMRMEGGVLTTENAKEFSSAAKGETLEDSIRVMSGYADVIVLRHYEIGAAERAAQASSVPVINAGDGAGQHPTQALLDLYTIRRECGNIDGITVALVGDLKHGRTVRSLSYLLGKYRNVSIKLISPPELRLGSDVKEYLDKHDVAYSEHESLEVIDEADVVYQTRIQKERFSSDMMELDTGKFTLTAENTNGLKEGAIIMHPLPRVDEISTDMDALPRAAYFRQANYGLYIRMALLQRVCD